MVAFRFFFRCLDTSAGVLLVVAVGSRVSSFILKSIVPCNTSILFVVVVLFQTFSGAVLN